MNICLLIHQNGVKIIYKKLDLIQVNKYLIQIHPIVQHIFSFVRLPMNI